MSRPFRISTFAVAALIAVLSLVDDPGDAGGANALALWIAERLFGDPGMADKVAHFLAYGTLGVTAILGFGQRYGTLLVAAALFGYGAVLEVLQALGGVRSGDPADLLANGLGLISGVVAARLVAAAAPRTFA